MTLRTLALAAFGLTLPALAQSPAYIGFDAKAVDPSLSPCQDFYQYACRVWQQRNPIPGDQASWGRFNELDERNKRLLRDMLETSAAQTSKSTLDQKIGDYFASCMDEKGIEALGTKPLEPELKRISGMTAKAQLLDALVRLHGMGVAAAFSFESGQDLKDASKVIIHVDQGGLGLPERDYYFRTDAKSVEIRKQYVAHLGRMFELLGAAQPEAAAKAKSIMDFETALAKASMDIVSRRDPTKLDHPMTVEQLAALSPSFDWKKYIAQSGAPAITALNVVNPDFVKNLEPQITNFSLDDWKTYLTWKYVTTAAPMLPDAFVRQNFEFYSRQLAGQKEMKPRWKRCVQYTDGDLGEALGQKYVELTFGKEGKTRMADLVSRLEKALEQDIRQIDWMTAETKTKALEKLHAIANKVGYPEKWRDYSKLEVRRGDAIGNSFRANHFEHLRQMAKVGKPVDKAEWYMSPPTVNAYYDPQNNNINFPAGILQPPFFDLKMDDPVNYGGIGAVIGHELTHGFDDQGRQFDAKGNLADWWTEKDGKEFEKRAECIEKQYGDYTAVGDLKLNGKLTLGENVADNGGLRIAYMALRDLLLSQPELQRSRKDGFSPEQRFFLGWAQVWCINQTEQLERLRAQTDPHSPGRHRVNGTVANMPEFQQAFGCKAGDPLVRGAAACRVW